MITPTTHAIVYIAGPMSGIKDANYPAFFGAAQWLREQGYQPRNPATVDTGGIARDWDWYMRKTIPMLLECDAVVLLDGWDESKGARIEQQLAFDLGMPRVDLWVLQSLAHRRVEE